MADMTLDDVYRAARQLPREEQDELIERLRAERSPKNRPLLDDIRVLPGGERFKDVSLRREDLYGDDGR